MPWENFAKMSDSDLKALWAYLQSIKPIENEVPERDSKAVTRDFVVTLERARPTRYVRVRVVRYGTLPEWHPGAGEQAWFFADEMVVR